MKSLPDEEVVVVNGDTLFKVELEDMLKQHRASRAQLTIALKEVPDSGRFGHIDITPDGVIYGFLEKSAAGPGLINGGVYVLNRHLLDEFPMPAGFSFERDLLEPNLAQIRPRGYLSDAYFIDMGVPDDYERAQDEVGGG